MPGDLVSSHYPQNFALDSFLGQARNTVQGNIPVFSNLMWPVYSGPIVDTASLGGTTSGVMIAVPVPVDLGVTISKVSIIIGATAASTPTHGFAALYSGTTVAAPPLIGQSTDQLTAAMGASARFDYTLTSATTITSAQAPYGFVWAAVMSTVTTTVASCLTMPCGAAAGNAFRWFTNSPLYFSITSGSGLSGTAPATLIEASALTVAPITFLW
ncbi:MAG: hypothetical protein ACLP1E_08745 [Acidimicrobiales bacterium]